MRFESKVRYLCTIIDAALLLSALLFVASMTFFLVIHVARDHPDLICGLNLFTSVVKGHWLVDMSNDLLLQVLGVQHLYLYQHHPTAWLRVR